MPETPEKPPTRIEYPSPEVLKLRGRQSMTIGLTWWAATDRTPEYYSIGWSEMSKDQVRSFAYQLLAMIRCMPELKWAPFQEFGIPDPAQETDSPPSGPVTIGSTGYKADGDITVYWTRWCGERRLGLLAESRDEPRTWECRDEDGCLTRSKRRAEREEQDEREVTS